MAQNLLYKNTDTVAYSYDIRNMLTETHNKHFSERFHNMYIDQCTMVNLPHTIPTVYININWGELFSPSGKILTSPPYVRSTTKYLTTTAGPAYPTIYMR